MSKISFFIALFLISASANAQEQSHIDAARELLKATNADQIIQHTYDQMYPQLIGMSDQLGFSEDQRPIFDKFLERMVAVMREEMSWAKMEPLMVKAYVDVYSEGELRDLTEFYLSPVGQKFVAKTPELLEASTQATQGMLQDFASKLAQVQQELVAELKQQAAE